MTAPPFVTLPVRGKKDVLRARQRARQIAALLHFPPLEQACIAAGTFAVSCRALGRLGRFRLCFQIEANQLNVFARPSGRNRTLSRARSEEGVLLRLAKSLPQGQPVDEADLAWLVRNTEGPALELFEEVIRQNQEVLSLLHELAAGRKEELASGGQPSQPYAA
jgi:hypothetical protein